MSRIASILALTLSSFVLVACQSSQPETSDQASSEQYESPAPDAERQAARPRNQQPAPTVADEQEVVRADRQLPRLEGKLSSDGYGMSMIIDGSSPEAFASSLQLISSDTSTRQYQQLNSALSYLQVYSMPSGGLPEFYQMFDGLTAEEIVAMAKQRSGR